MASIADQIDSRGWRQGSLLDHQYLNPDRLPDNFACDVIDEAVLISQSCDVVHPNLDNEPVVEFLVGRRVPNLNGEFTHGKNPRRLHLPVQGTAGEVLPIEFRPHHRVMVPRSQLAIWSPLTGRYLLDRDTRELALWLAERYQRPALPDAFNRRLANQERALKKLFKRHSSQVSGLYVKLHPAGEVGDDILYRVNLLVLLPIQCVAQRDAVDAFARQMQEYLKKENVDMEYEVRTEAEVPISIYRNYKKLPGLDYLSLRGEPPDPLPPGGA